MKEKIYNGMVIHCPEKWMAYELNSKIGNKNDSLWEVERGWEKHKEKTCYGIGYYNSERKHTITYYCNLDDEYLKEREKRIYEFSDVEFEY